MKYINAKRYLEKRDTFKNVMWILEIRLEKIFENKENKYLLTLIFEVFKTFEMLILSIKLPYKLRGMQINLFWIVF